MRNILLISLLALASCNQPAPTDVTPAPTQAPAPTPTPIVEVPVPGGVECYLDGREYTLTRWTFAESFYLGYAVNEAIAAETGCVVGQLDCLVKGHPQDFMDKVIDRLQKMGYCAGQLDPGVSDEIAAGGYDTRNKTAGKAWHGFHIWSGPGWDDYSFPGKVVWYTLGTGAAQGSYRGNWLAVKE